MHFYVKVSTLLFLSDCEGLVTARGYTSARGNYCFGLVIQHTAHAVVYVLALPPLGSVCRYGYALGILDVSTTRVLRVVLRGRMFVNRVWDRIFLTKHNVVNSSDRSCGSALMLNNRGLLVWATISK